MHSAKIVSMATSSDGFLLATAGEDKALKIFDVINFGKCHKIHVYMHVYMYV